MNTLKPRYLPRKVFPDCKKIKQLPELTKIVVENPEDYIYCDYCGKCGRVFDLNGYVIEE